MLFIPFFGCFLVLRKLLFVSFCVVVWVLFSVFSIFCITSLVSATPRNHPFFKGSAFFSNLKGIKLNFFSVKNDTQKDKGLNLGAELYIIMAGRRNGESRDKPPKRSTFLSHMNMER